MRTSTGMPIITETDLMELFPRPDNLEDFDAVRETIDRSVGTKLVMGERAVMEAEHERIVAMNPGMTKALLAIPEAIQMSRAIFGNKAPTVTAAGAYLGMLLAYRVIEKASERVRDEEGGHDANRGEVPTDGSE